MAHRKQSDCVSVVVPTGWHTPASLTGCNEARTAPCPGHSIVDSRYPRLFSCGGILHKDCSIRTFDFRCGTPAEVKSF